jgi:hypothetical protein
MNAKCNRQVSLGLGLVKNFPPLPCAFSFIGEKTAIQNLDKYNPPPNKKPPSIYP